MLILWVPPWILDRVRFSEPEVCYFDPSLNKEFVFVVATVGHHGAFFIMIFCYTYVFIFMRKRRKVAAPTFNYPAGNRVSKNISDQESSHSNSNPKSISYIDTRATIMSQVSSNQGSSHLQVPEQDRKLNATASTSTSSKFNRAVREKRVFVTLTYIIIAYAILWLPFHIVFDVSIHDPALVPEQVLNWAFWMAYFNSTINPFLYNFSSPEFRKAFKRLLSTRVC